jgi:hypothetical protein
MITTANRGEVATSARGATGEVARREGLALDFFIRPQYTLAARQWLFLESWPAILRACGQRLRSEQLHGGRIDMPKYVIERVPDVGDVTPQQIIAISLKSCSVLNNLGPKIQWLHSYVTQDKIYCVYIAPNEEMMREHARQGGFPANRISEVKLVIDPRSAEA